MDPLLIMLRLLVPLLIFRAPLLGGLAALGLDGLDWHITLSAASVGHLQYGTIDKLLDLYYLTIEAYTVLFWKSLPAKTAALTLYMYRTVGVLAFLLSGNETFLFVGANIFESWFLWYLSCQWVVGHAPKMSKKLITIGILTLTIPKLYQEYVMHVLHRLDWRFISIVVSPTITMWYDQIIGQLVIAAAFVGIAVLAGV